MHEWVLISVLFEWETGRVTLSFDTDEAGLVSIIAESVSDLHVPQMNDWGGSVHVNEVRGPSDLENGRRKLEIEMQSGDVIRIEAVMFHLPPAEAASGLPKG